MDYPHNAIAIAQTSFYGTTMSTTIWVLRRNHGNVPKMAWHALIIFNLFRLIGGILVLCLVTNMQNHALVISAIFFFNVGLIMLHLATVGLIRILIDAIQTSDWELCHLAKVINFTAALQFCLLVVAGGLSSQDSTSTAARVLTKIAFFLFTWTLAWMTYSAVKLYAARSSIPSQDWKIIQCLAIALPLLATRTAYSLLQIFYLDTDYQPWNPIYGSAIAFGVMALLPEFIVLVMYLIIGWYRCPCSESRESVTPRVEEGKGEVTP